MDAGSLQTSHRPMGSDKSLQLSLLDLPPPGKALCALHKRQLKIYVGISCKSILGHFLYNGFYIIWDKDIVKIAIHLDNTAVHADTGCFLFLHYKTEQTSQNVQLQMVIPVIFKQLLYCNHDIKHPV